MGRLILVAGPSGSGKSTSLRNLNPKETFIIKPNSKPLPFTGGKKNYSVEKKNLMISKDLKKLKASILAVNEKAKHIKNLVIEDFFHFMLAKTMDDINVPGFNKFKDLANEIYQATAGIEHQLRDDLNLIILTHSEEVRDAQGVPMTKLKLTGKFTEEVTDLPSFFTYVFEAKTEIVDGKIEHRFLTNSRTPSDLAKTPMGIFDDLFVENDLATIIEKIKEKE